MYLVLFCEYFIHRAFFPSRVDDMLWKDTWLSRTNRIPTSDSMPPIRQFHAAASPPVQRIDSAFTGVSISSEMKISEIKSTFRPNKSSGYCINGIIVFIPPAWIFWKSEVVKNLWREKSIVIISSRNAVSASHQAAGNSAQSPREYFVLRVCPPPLTPGVRHTPYIHR